MGTDVTRRRLLQALPALALAPLASRVSAQGAPPIRVRGINHVTLAGFRRQAVGGFLSGPLRHADQQPAGHDGQPADRRRTAASGRELGRIERAEHQSPVSGRRRLQRRSDHLILAQRGITRTDEAGNAGGGGLGGGPLKMRVRMRGPEAGGAREGTPELYFSDPDGVVIQLQDPRYCGGAGPLGNVCPAAGAVAEEGPDRASRAGATARSSARTAPAPTRSIRIFWAARPGVSGPDGAGARRAAACSS